MPAPAALYLAELRPTWVAGSIADVEPIVLPNRLEAEDIAARELLAFDRGREEGLAAARADYERRLDEERARIAERLAAERHAWASEQGQRLAEQVAACFAELTAQIADAVGGILMPFLDEQIRKQAIDDLTRNIAVLAAGGQDKAITITGPQDLLERIAATLGAAAGALAFVPSDDIDVRITAEGTVMETQLAAWRGRLDEANR
jgi:hypothetical protein